MWVRTQIEKTHGNQAQTTIFLLIWAGGPSSGLARLAWWAKSEYWLFMRALAPQNILLWSPTYQI